MTTTQFLIKQRNLWWGIEFYNFHSLLFARNVSWLMGPELVFLAAFFFVVIPWQLMNSFNFHPTEMALRGVEFTLHFDSRQQPCERSSYNGNANFTSKRFNMTPHTSEAFKIQLPDLTTTEQSSEFAENVWKRGDEETRKVFPSPRRLSLSLFTPCENFKFPQLLSSANSEN